MGNIGRQLAMVRESVTLAPGGSFQLDQLGLHKTLSFVSINV